VIELIRDENGATESVPDTVPRPDVRPEIASDPRIVLPPANVPVVATEGWPSVKVARFAWPPGDVVGPGRAGLVTGGDLDRSPQTRFQAAPLYPAEARREGRSGTVTVEFVVDESGTVVTPRVASSSDRVFEEAALRAVARWRFEPGRRHGQVVRFRMAVPIHFSLNE
jgi:protein TonB